MPRTKSEVFVKICFDPIVDSGSLTVRGKAFNYNTLEPKILKANSLATLNSVLGTYLVEQAIKIKGERVLITTYTESNEAEIRRGEAYAKAGADIISSRVRNENRKDRIGPGCAAGLEPASRGPDPHSPSG